MSSSGAPAGLARLLAALRAAEVTITCAAFAVLVAVIFADVVWRWTTGSGIIWAREIGVFANIVLTIIGIGVASADGTHLRPRFFDRIFPASWDSALTRLQEALTALGFAALAWIAIQVVRETVQLDDRSIVLRWVIWPVQASLPIAFLLGALRHGIYASFPALRPMERDESTVEVPAR